MKISMKVNSRFLACEDILAPIIVTIDCVTEDCTLRNKDVLYFLDDVLKPLPLNWTNRNTLVSAFGDESDNWHGRQVEIYFDSSVPNPRNPSRPGGIKVRMPIPAPLAAPPVLAAAPAGSRLLVQARNVAPPAPTPQIGVHEAHMIILDGFATARTKAKLDEFARWGQGFDFTRDQTDEQSDAYHAAQCRLAAGPASLRRPVTA